MILFAFSRQDRISTWAGEELIRIGKFEPDGEFQGSKVYRSGNSLVLESDIRNIDSEFIDGMKSIDCVVFLSSHTSSKGIESFTAHPEGNWNSEARLGGLTKQLSMAAPLYMMRFARIAAESLYASGSSFILEATHHGPLLKIPSMFVEFGGGEKEKSMKEKAELLASMAASLDGPETDYSKIVFGIGGMHYAENFTRLELSKGYAFSHIMPKHHCSEIDMLDQAFEMSTPRPESAVIEWKSIKAKTRNPIIKRLEEIGIDYEKV